VFTVNRVEVRAPGVRRPLADVSGEALIASMTRPGGLPAGAPDSDSAHHRRSIGRCSMPSTAPGWATPGQLTSYIGYGQRAIAAARGVVVSSVDGIKDNTPQGTLEDLPPRDETVGNHGRSLDR
jgi:hypothetical protein